MAKLASDAKGTEHVWELFQAWKLLRQLPEKVLTGFRDVFLSRKCGTIKLSKILSIFCFVFYYFDYNLTLSMLTPSHLHILRYLYSCKISPKLGEIDPSI